jgi:transcriptional regulator with XRE-family HTH domain
MEFNMRYPELKAARAKMGVTQKAVAAATGLSANVISEIELRKHVASRRYRETLSAFFGRSESDFFDERTGLAR